jgi:site-specific DNA recombinase
LDLAVWQEVCTLLPHPKRLAEEYQRRLQPETRAQRTPLATVEGQSSQLRQGIARLIDSYAEGLIDKAEFEPRITRLRQRLARLEEQRQALAEVGTRSFSPVHTKPEPLRWTRDSRFIQSYEVHKPLICILHR